MKYISTSDEARRINEQIVDRIHSALGLSYYPGASAIFWSHDPDLRMGILKSNRNRLCVAFTSGFEYLNAVRIF